MALVERLGTFSTVFCLYLSMLHDAEFYGETSGNYLPFSHAHLVGMVSTLRDVYVSLHMERHLPHSYTASRHSPLAAASVSDSSSTFSSPRVVEMRPSVAEYQQMKKV